MASVTEELNVEFPLIWVDLNLRRSPVVHGYRPVRVSSLLGEDEVLGIQDGGVRLSPISSHAAPFFPQQTCAVCLEDFKGKDDLGVLSCQHAFHRK